MLEKDRTQFVGLMVQLGEVYQQKLSDLQLDGYWQALRDLPLLDVRAGMFHSFKTRRFFPKPAEIRSDIYRDDEQEPPSRPKALSEGTRYLGMGKECAAYLTRIWAGDVDRASIVAWMRNAETRWPGIGWGQEARVLESADPAGIVIDYAPPAMRARGLEVVGKTRDGKDIVRVKGLSSPTGKPKVRDLAAEKAAILAMEREPAEVPF